MANNTLIGALRAEATLDGGKFVDGAKKIRKESKATEVQLKRDFGSMGNSVKGFGAALTAGLSIGLLSGLISKALDYATSIKDVAKQVGVTTTELQEFRHAASQVGIAQNEADKGLESLNKTLSKAASGSKTATAALAAVGVTLKDIQTKSRLEIFGQIADQMNKQGGAAKNAAAANAVFGESYSKLVPLLDKGSQGVNELRQSVHSLGGVLSEDQIQRADETARKLDDVRRVLAAQIAGVVADNASSIVSLANSLGQLTSAVINFLGSDPQSAAALIGALAGARLGGLPGALAGGIAGLEIGTRIRDSQPLPPHTKKDVPFLRHNLAVYAGELRNKRGKGIPVKQSELDRLKRMTDKLNAAAGNVPSSGSFGGDLPQFLASAPKGGGRKRTPRAPRDRSDDVTFQFEQELRRAHMDTLRAQQSLATTDDKRAEIALQLLDLQREDQRAELDNRVRRAERDFAEGKITAGALQEVKVQADKLRAEYDSQYALERKAIADDLLAAQAEDKAALADSAKDIEIEKLQLEASLKETAAERRAVELRILEVMKQQEKARLEALVADQKAAPLARQQAQQRLDSLDAIYAGRAANVVQGTRGPMEDYLASLPTTAAKAQMALEQLQVQGFEGLIDAALALSDGFDSAKDALLNVLKQFLLGLARMELQKGVASLFSAGIPGFASGGFTGWGSGIAGLVHGREGVLNMTGMRTLGIPNLDALNRGAPLSTVSNDNNARSPQPGRGDIHNHYHGVSDFDSFRRNERQIARSTRRTLGINQ